MPFIARYRKEQTGNLDEVAIRQVHRGQGALGPDHQAPGVHRRGDRPAGEADARARGAHPRHVRRDRARGHLSALQAEAEDEGARWRARRGSSRWRTGCGRAGTARPIAGGRDARSARGRFRRRRQGRRGRRPPRSRARTTSSSSACRRTRRCGSGCARALFERGSRADAKGREGQDAEPLRELLLLPGARARAARSRTARTATWRCAAAGWRRSWSCRSAGRSPRTASPIRSHDELIAAVRDGRLPGGGARRSRARRCSSARRAWRCAAHVAPSIETEVHKALREVADTAAIGVFAENVRKLLLAAPFGPKAVLGVDPGLRTGCKLAVVDGSGALRRARALHAPRDAGGQGVGGAGAGRPGQEGRHPRGRRRQRHRRPRDRDLRARGAPALRPSTCRW